MTNDVTPYQSSTGLVVPDLVDVVARANRDGLSMSVEQARELTAVVRARSDSLDQLVAMMYAARIWQTLGYESWARYCEAEDIRMASRVSREQKQRIHFFLYWLQGMPRQAVCEFTGYSGQTVVNDAERERDRLVDEGVEVADRRETIIDTQGRRRIPPKPRAVAAPDPSHDVVEGTVDDDADDDVMVEAEVISETRDERVPGQRVDDDPLGGKDWPTRFAEATSEMRRTMERARRVMTHPRLKPNANKVPDGDAQAWTDWSSEIVDWVLELTLAREDGR